MEQTNQHRSLNEVGQGMEICPKDTDAMFNGFACRERGNLIGQRETGRLIIEHYSVVCMGTLLSAVLSTLKIKPLWKDTYTVSLCPPHQCWCLCAVMRSVAPRQAVFDVRSGTRFKANICHWWQDEVNRAVTTAPPAYSSEARFCSVM